MREGTLPGRITVIQLLPSLEAGGVERGVVEVVGALAERGHRAIVVSSGGRMVKRVEALGGEHITLPIHKKSVMTPRTIQPLRKLIRKTGASVLHARSRVPAWVGYLAWRSLPKACGPAWITTVHGLYSVNRFSRIMTTGQRVEVVSETVRDYVLTNYSGTDPHKLVLNHRGVDPEGFPYGYHPSEEWVSQFHKDHPQLKGQFVITLAGRITRRKGHHDLISSIGKLRQQGIEAHGLIVGDADPRRHTYAEELREAVAAQGISEHITFSGHRSDIREVFAVSDAVVSLSTKPESFGRSVLEAVRLGRPVVGYDHGGVGEVLAEVYPAGRTPPSNPNALVESLAKVARCDAAPPSPIGDKFLLSDMLERTMTMYADAAS